MTVLFNFFWTIFSVSCLNFTLLEQHLLYDGTLESTDGRTSKSQETNRQGHFVLSFLDTLKRVVKLGSPTTL